MQRYRARTFLIVLLLIAGTAFARNDSWLEVRTPHFAVVSNAGDREARRIADQLERMRAVFHKAFPNVAVDGSRIIVLAVKEKRDFQALEPEVYLAKGQIQLAGLFLRVPDKNYILLRLDAEGDHPYETVYHEYTHFLLSSADEWLPLWVNEGLAQYYETTEIRDKEVELGQPSQGNLYLLRQNRLMPLATLFKVDHNSPYYHEENKGSIFYAESWALTHCLQIEDRKNNTHRLQDYLKLVSAKVDAVTAATQAFGDLNALQKHLESYVSQANFYFFRMPGALDVDLSAIKTRPLTLTDADALRADFLAYNGREKDSRALLDHILHDDPKNVIANETMGYLAFRANDLDEAEKWYGQAVESDSQNYLAQYYFAVIAMRRQPKAEIDPKIENSLRASIKFNPAFAPSYDALSMYYGMHHTNLDEARMLNLQAVQLDPDNLGFRMNAANLQLERQRPDEAIAVLNNALKEAKTPEQTAMINDRILQLQQYTSMLDRVQEHAADDSQRRGQIVSEVAEKVKINVPEEDESKHGPKRTVHGTLRDIQCAYPASMNLRVDGSKPTQLHSRNYLKVEYSALNFTPSSTLDPCKDLEGMKAKVDYYESLDTAKPGFIIAIQVSK